MKIYQKFKRVIPFFLGLCLSLTSCVNEEKRAERIEEVKETIESIEEWFEEATFPPEKIEEKVEIDELTQSYIDLVNNVDINYNHEEFYLSNDYIDTIIQNNKSLGECTYEFDGNIKNIIEQIKSNSNTKDFFNERELEILERILKKLKQNGDSNLDEDFHKISTIGIEYGSKTSIDRFADDNQEYLAYFDEDTNTIYLNDKHIQAVASQESVSYYYFLEYVLEHEFNHVRQTLCDCRATDGSLTRIAYDKYATFLLESSAETSLYQEQSTNRKINYTYSYEREKQSQLLLLAMFKRDSMDDFFKAIYDDDIEGLMNFLDVSDEEIYDIYKIMYAMDGTLCRNDLPYAIMEDNKLTYGELYDEIGFTYKEDIFKLFLNRFLEYNSINKLKLEDNLAVYFLVKNMLMYDCCSYHDMEDHIEKVYPETTIQNIYLMDTYFMEYLSVKYGISVEELREKERIDGYLGAQALREYILDGEITYSTYQKQVNRILKDFPLLKDIIENYSFIFLYDYKNALENNNIYVYK